MVDLPQELVDIILEDFVGHKDLKACALTARAFLPSSQRGLFRRMSLRWESQSQRRRQGSSGRVGPAFRWELRFLCENPHLALYVRDLTLDIPKSDADQSTLEAVLRLLGNLERVAINGYGRMWDELLGSLASAILTTISLPSLRRVHLRRLTNVPHSVIFHAATSVRVLSLNRIVPQRHGDIPHDVPPNTNLEHLILPWSLTTGTLLQLCEFLLTAQDLRRLSVNAGYHFALATASSAHLRYLEVDFGGALLICISHKSLTPTQDRPNHLICHCSQSSRA
ncbi:hypothetical protein B0H16DRAFT_1523282 [Mycena metata]|uniref:F-box domain-containing protein n=1 Tax=Mycena metata TaxID=1033252 RepID=A0AAD7JMS5_9AGAR|nr:hypothetical protein B0H16DRAFT_1523282 [Mycena metata]